MTIVQNPWPFSHLLIDEVKSSRPATANIPRTLAGNAALAQGMTIGGNLVDGAPNLAPLMGHGYRGHDHSGGAGGAPLFRDVATVPMSSGETSAAGEFTTGGGFIYVPQDATAPNTVGAFREITVPRPTLWIPPCAQDGAYRDLYIRGTARLSATSGTLSAGDTLTVRVRNVRPEVDAGANEVTITFTGGAGNYSVVSADPLRFHPGTYNRLNFAYRFSTVAGGSNRAPRLGWWSMSAGILSL